MALLARGAHYFGENGYPVTARVAQTESAGRPSHEHDYTTTEHYHDFTELVLVLRGSGMHVLAGSSFPVGAGDVFVLQGSQIHCFRERQGLTLLNVMFDPERIDLPSSLLRRIPGYSALFMLEPTFRQTHRFLSRLHLSRGDLGAAEAFARRIGEESLDPREGHEAVRLALLVQLITFLSRRYGESRTPEAQALLRVGNLISTLDLRFREPWTLAGMGQLAHLSRSGLLRTFRRATGQAPIGYLIGIRVEEAMRRLEQSDLTITEIGLEVGFSDGNYFSRQFRQICGSSPSDFRKRFRG